ncbi:MAG: sulfatase-like hydrolase/transferase [Opitutaceae bacterium]
MNFILSLRRFLTLSYLGILLSGILPAGEQKRPNIMWIVGEDAAPDIGCYGQTVIQTPNLDRMASQGVRFAKAFATGPVCSPSRSALITGMYQTTLGAQNHRSQQTVVKGGGNTFYYGSYELPDSIQLVPALFQEAGYFTSLGAGPDCSELGKTDYNFIFDPSVYDGADWRLCPSDRPFFAQIMLQGGKEWSQVELKTDPTRVELSPDHPDHPVVRKRWAAYLDSWVRMDNQVGRILDDLEEAGVADDTIVFFLTDHGPVHARGKRFLYDQGIRIPLLVRLDQGRSAGSVRDDLVLHIDVAASSLGLAGIPVPSFMDGRNLFGPDYEPRSSVFCARDRCDETVDIIRCIRTDRFKYIRNFMSFRSHMQPNEAMDHQDILITMREMDRSGQFTELQGRIFNPVRPVEELYDLQVDPHETVNLADDEEFAGTLQAFRGELYAWMEESGDLGLIPEPILEDLGRDYGNKAFILGARENQDLVSQLIDVIEDGEKGRRDELLTALESPRPSVCYWAATWLGLVGNVDCVDELKARVTDPDPTVRIAVALALHQLGEAVDAAELLAEEIRNYNLLVGLYAIRALESMGEAAQPAHSAIIEARSHPYEYVRRIANRLSMD